MPATALSVARAVAAARQVAFDQREQPRDALLRRRPVGDVFAREGVLVHLRAHVAGIDRVHAQLGVLGRQHRAQLLERRLARAVPAPALVGLDGGVGGDVEDARAAASRGSASWTSASGARTLTS